MTCDYWSRNPEEPLPYWFTRFGYEDTVSFYYKTKVRMAKIKHFVWKMNPWRKEVHMVSNFEYVPRQDQIALPKQPPVPPRLFFPVPLYLSISTLRASIRRPSGMPWPKP
ncbi:hypothetical protein PRIPAC_96463 [Pristionchus pacificus]|uniref:Uncharacterized protein n=1 Tax=Pristionchus pacificus TaxID=54126 RepID=A0A454Y278_PRIPA|nr:hypothetical protein PRIPAC_96463 [Pristionchus pacificus]|eukprot:PDM81680.1 hypothetical protein PRIPAC_30661 [Pristionchus pacificus]